MGNLKMDEPKRGISKIPQNNSKVKFSDPVRFNRNDLIQLGSKDMSLPTIEKIILNSKQWIRENTILFPLPAIISCDWHIPHVSTEWFAIMCGIAEKRKIPNLIINGDFFDQDQFKIWLDSGSLVSWDSELQAGKEVFNKLLKQFRKIFIILGNHDERIFRKVETRFSAKHLFAQMISLPLLDDRVIVSNIKYCTSEDNKWIVCHPKNYSKAATIAPANIIAVEHKNVIGAHGHHLGMARDISGKYWAVDGGGMFSEDSMTYNGNTIKSNHAKWANGFVLLNENSELRLYGDDLEF